MSYFLPDDKITEIKESCDIVKLISEYVPLKKAGQNYKGLCPFHADNEPSFIVSETKQIFHCFGCGIGGNVFTFLMKFENLSFPEAVKKLAGKYGISLPEKKLSPAQNKLIDERNKLFKINEIAAHYFNNLLLYTPEGEMARSYLKKRGISPETISAFKLGFAPSQGDGLVHFFKEKDIPLELAQKIGLIKPSNKNGWYDSFRNRIIFPIINYNQRIIGFGGRALAGDSAKYINSSDSLVYKKSHSLYGLNAALGAIRQEDFAIVVEGYFDLLSLHQHGITNSVAALGTALTEGQITLLKRFTRKIVVAFDPDVSGINATLKSLPLFLAQGISPKVVVLPMGTDPDTFIQQAKREGFRKKLEQAIPLMEFSITQILDRHDPSRIDHALSIVKEIAPLLSLVKDATEKNLYIQRVAQKINVSEEVIRSEMKMGKKHSPEMLEKEARVPDYYHTEELLLQLMILYPETIPHVTRVVTAEELNEPQLKHLFSRICECSLSPSPPEPTKLIDQLEEETLRNLVAQLVIKGEQVSSHDVSKMLNNCIHKIKERGIKREIQALNAKIKEAQHERNDQAMRRFLLHKQTLLEKRKQYGSTHSFLHIQ